MKDRIKQFMEHKGISAGELSAMLEVQRSNISHILNGRNKPGAAFIEKLLLVFPKLNARWLLTGQGEMMENAVTIKEVQQEIITEPVLKVEEKRGKENGTEEIIESPKREEADKPTEKIITPASAEIDRMVLLFKDGTFTSYKHRGED